MKEVSPSYTSLKMSIVGYVGLEVSIRSRCDRSQRQFALKKIRCPTGSDGVKEAMREVEAYRRFKCVSGPTVCLKTNPLTGTLISFGFW